MNISMAGWIKSVFSNQLVGCNHWTDPVKCPLPCFFHVFSYDILNIYIYNYIYLFVIYIYISRHPNTETEKMSFGPLKIPKATL